MTKFNKFEIISEAADKMDLDSRIGREVNELLASAYLVASDAVFARKDAPASDLGDLALSTLRTALCECFSVDVENWFLKQGLCW